MSLATGWRRRLAPGALLRALLVRRGVIEAPLGLEWRGALDAIRGTRARVPLLMSDAAALQIQIAVRAARRLDGIMAEAGVLMGGSARLICAAKGEVPLHLFDAFETFQTPVAAADPREQAVRSHFKAVHGRRAEVERLLSDFPAVTLHPGLFPLSAAPLAGARFAFVHLDLDLVGSTEDALAFFHPRLVAGGILIGDDYDDPGVRATFRAFFDPLDDSYFELPWGQVMVVRQIR